MSTPSSPQPKQKFDFTALLQKSPDVLHALAEALRQSQSIMMYNRMHETREITWDSVPYVFPALSVVVVPYAVARHAVHHSHCYYAVKEGNGPDAVEEVYEDWALVPFGYETFGKPFTKNQSDQVADPIAYMDLNEQEQYLPTEADAARGKKVEWRRVSYKPTNPRSALRPVVADGITVQVISPGGVYVG